MPTIWSAISGHGYGHAAQVVPVLNRLGTLVPEVRAILRTTVPASFFRDRLSIPWELQSVQQDVGCIQKGPLEIDVEATWDALTIFHTNWKQRVEEESRAIKAAKPRVILADTPYVAIQAGHDAGIPTIALANFTWSEVLRPFSDPMNPGHQALLHTIEDSYGRATMALRIAPGLPMPAFSSVMDIGPIAEPAISDRSALRHHLRLEATEQLVLIAFGGIPLESLPWNAMDTMTGYHFVVAGTPTRTSARVHALDAIPMTFRSVLASVDLVMTKPGYSTIVEAAALGLPVVYVRRYTFADEAPLVSFLHQHGRGQELSLRDFLSGNWELVFGAIRNESPPAARPHCTGAIEAAHHFATYF